MLNPSEYDLINDLATAVQDLMDQLRGLAPEKYENWYDLRMHCLGLLNESDKTLFESDNPSTPTPKAI